MLLQRDPIYPVLMERLHTALPGYEFRVDTTPPLLNAHLMLCTEADAAVLLPFSPAQPEVERTPIMHNTFYLALAPEHPLYPRDSLQLAGLAGQRVYYEPLYQEIVEYASVQPGMPFSTMEWCSVENYAHVYTELLAGRGMFLFPVRYPSYPAAWYRQVWLPLPDTVLLTLRDDPCPEILTPRQVFTEVYGERIKALLP